MPWVAPAIGMASNIFTGAMAAKEQGAARKQAKDAYDASVRDLEAIGIPTVEAQQIVMEQYKSEGQWTPELEQAVKLGDSEMLGISTDPAYKEASIRALNSLRDIGDSGGMTLSDNANLEKVMGDINATEKGKRDAILQNAQERGGYGSGSALAAQLMNQQKGADLAHSAGLETLASARQRALDAIAKGGALGSNLRSQEFAEEEAKKKAQDAINAWNAENSAATQQRNAATKNQALRENLANRQNLSNSNVDLRNKQETYNKGLLQTDFQNKLNLAGAKSNARSGQANNAIAAGNAAGQMWGGVGSAVAQGATAYGQMQNENDNRNKDRDLIRSFMTTQTQRPTVPNKAGNYTGDDDWTKYAAMA